jgi:hypothetical protein
MAMLCMLLLMDPNERLRKARRDAKFATAADAARAFGWDEVTYLSHENGNRGIRPAVAERYAKALGVPAEWILYGKGKSAPKAKPEKRLTVPLKGYVGAGAEAHFFSDQGDLGEVGAPANATEDTIAVEIRGDSLGSFFDRWLVYYDEVRRPVTPDLINKLCVVGIEDGRILIKKIQRSRTRGLFHLLSQTEPPILDVAIEWAARVKHMEPQ